MLEVFRGKHQLAGVAGQFGCPGAAGRFSGVGVMGFTQGYHPATELTRNARQLVLTAEDLEHSAESWRRGELD